MAIMASSFCTTEVSGVITACSMSNGLSFHPTTSRVSVVAALDVKDTRISHHLCLEIAAASSDPPVYRHFELSHSCNDRAIAEGVYCTEERSSKSREHANPFGHSGWASRLVFTCFSTAARFSH